MADARQDALAVYRKMRRFADTPEPAGGKASKARNIFVVQKHAATRLHYDFRLELDGVLKSWAVTRGPSRNPADKRLAVRTEDHPMDYALFEGTIPAKNYGAGTVLLWDQGIWTPEGDPRDGLKRGNLKFSLEGERMKGKWVLVRMRNKEKEKRENWLLIKEKDAHAKDDRPLTESYTTSVTTKRNLAEIEKSPASRSWSGRSAKKPPAKRKASSKKRAAPPKFHKPQLATLVDDVPAGNEWIFEVKFDGYRTLLSASGKKVRFFTRTGLDWTEKFENLVPAVEVLDLNGTLIDGEIVVLDRQGRSSFSGLQKALRDGNGPLAFFAFDLLFVDGKDIRKQPLIKRKEQLQQLLATARKGPIFYSDHLEEGGAEMFATLCEKGFEGIIAKRADAAYREERGKSWLKIKCAKDQEMVIGGYRPSTRARPFSSLLLGVHEDGALRYAGRVGTGFSEGDFEELMPKFRKLERKTSPFGDVPPDVARDAVWLKPQLVAQIGIAEFTSDGIVRHARYLGLRGDKKAADVTDEKPMPLKSGSTRKATKPKSNVVGGVTLSNPDRILYKEQGLTKHDLATYFEAAWPHMKPFVQNRLVSLVRCPEGRSGKCFFQRHMGAGLKDQFKTMNVELKKAHEDYIYLDSKKALITAAQMGVLELHIWGSKISRIDQPDRIVFDLDPAPGLGFGAISEAALLMRDALDALGLKSFPLLSGGKGIHVVAPIRPHHPWPVIKQFTKSLAQRFAESEPKRFIANMSKEKRKGLIFIDYLRNDRTSTAIAPYSPRARENAPVAWPIEWSDLGGITASNDIHMEEARARLEAGEVNWKDCAATKQSLTAAALKALDIDAKALTR